MAGLRSVSLLLAVPFAALLSACGSSAQSGAGEGGPVHYVVVGQSGTLAGSNDGSAWSLRAPATDEDLHGVAAAKDGTVVAVGDAGTVLYSGDGAKTFQVAAAPTQSDLQAAAVDDQGHFVIGGNDDHTYYSDDGGKTWTAGKVIDPDGTVLITHLATDGSGRFLASGTVYHQATGGVGIRNRVYFSTDGGDSWSHVFDGDLQSIGGSLTSGLQGVATDGAHHYVTVGWKSQAFFASGDPTSTWNASSGLPADVKLDAVVRDDDNQRFIAGTLMGVLYSSSDNGQSFTKGCAPLEGQSSVSDMVAGGGRVLAVGPGLGLVTSDGGGSCTTVPIAANDTNLIVFGVAYLP